MNYFEEELRKINESMEDSRKTMEFVEKNGGVCIPDGIDVYLSKNTGQPLYDYVLSLSKKQKIEKIKKLLNENSPDN